MKLVLIFPPADCHSCGSRHLVIPVEYGSQAALRDDLARWVDYFCNTWNQYGEDLIAWYDEKPPKRAGERAMADWGANRPVLPRTRFIQVGGYAISAELLCELDAWPPIYLSEKHTPNLPQILLLEEWIASFPTVIN